MERLAETVLRQNGTPVEPSIPSLGGGAVPPSGLGWRPPEKYQPLRVIGAGAMGTVLLARDVNLGRLVALKILRTRCEDYLTRLRHEARTLARLEHSAIVRVHDLDIHDGRLYLAMEYLSGGNLALARFDPVPLVQRLRGVVDGLAHAHRNGIIHRDVKPENILLGRGRDGGREVGGGHRAVLTDFGLACGEDEGSELLRHAIVGTPLTMSPEQVAGEPVGFTSDVFSFGVTLYRQLTGAWPFPGRTVADVFEAIRTGTPTPLISLNRSVPRRLDAIVLKAMEKQPARRFSSMEELGRAFDRFLVGRAWFSFPRAWWKKRRVGGVFGPHIHPEDPS